jgi:Tol biopolymer transport system component
MGTMRISRGLWRAAVAAVAAGCAVVTASGVGAAGAVPMTTRMSVSSAGAQDDGLNVGEAISAGGGLVAFTSNATDLVPRATFTTQVYLHNRFTRRTTILSRGPTGAEGDRSSDSFQLSMSGDGQVVAFSSSADNLVRHDRNRAGDVFVRDRRVGVTKLVSQTMSGAEANGTSDYPYASADGRFVAFDSLATNLVVGDTNRRADVFVRDLQTGRIRLVSRSVSRGIANGLSFPVGISRHGRYVAFESQASNIVAGGTLGRMAVYVRDLATHRTVRVSPAGAKAPCYGTSMSSDGRYVVYDSKAANLVASDTNHMEDVFVADRAIHTLTRVSVATGGTQQLGADGAYADGGSISANGRTVAFASIARNLVPGDTNTVYDVFVHDLVSNTTKRVSISSAGRQGDRRSLDPRISAGGRWVAFFSDARDLVAHDTNARPDIFLYGPVG